MYSRYNTIITSYLQAKTQYSVDNYLNEYEERLAEMENIFSKGKYNYIKELQSEIQEHKNRLSDLDDFRMKDILSEIDVDAVFELYKKENKFEYIIKNEYFNLLKYLIREGYLNENSSDYMTYFYGRSICKQDKNFILSVLNRNIKEYNYKINDLQKVVSRLSIVQFGQYEVLNFDLFEYLLKNKHKEELNEKLKRLIKQLNNTKNIQFISSFFDTGRETENFIESLNTNWNEFFQISLSDENFSEKQKHDYSILTMYYSSDEDIEQMNKDQCMTNYISNKEDYLNIKEPRLEKIIDRFKLLSISFSKIDSNISNKELLKAICENNMYVINIHNINMMIDLYYGNFNKSENLDELEKKQRHYSILSSKIESPILKYINQNISKYFDVMIEYCDYPIIDNEEVAVSLINNEDINLEQKSKYINKLYTLISDISDVNNKELWNDLLKKNILYSGNNVMEIFLNKVSIGENLISFINGNENNLNFKEIDEKYSKENKKSLYDSIIKCNKLKNDKYKNIVLDLYVDYEEFNIIDIDDEKLKILIDEEIIKMTETSLAFIREQYSSNVNYYILKNIKKYSEIMKSNIFEFEEFILLLEDKDIPVDILLNLLDFTSEQISVIDKCYPDQIISKILTTNLNKDDIKYLFEKYETYSNEIKFKISKIAQGGTMQIKIQNGEFNLSYPMIKDMLQSEDLQISQKINLLVSYINSQNLSEFLELLNISKLEELDEVEKLLKSNINIQKISATSTNEVFLEVLEKNKIIYKYKIIELEENEITKKYYEVIKKSPNEVV